MEILLKKGNKLFTIIEQRCNYYHSHHYYFIYILFISKSSKQIQYYR